MKEKLPNEKDVKSVVSDYERAKAVGLDPFEAFCFASDQFCERRLKSIDDRIESLESLLEKEESRIGRK